ncbi:hypothetical protein REPUB_Repub09cG0077900 [Reevesia pubescens]
MEGNKKSLTDAVEKEIDLRKQILKLYKDYCHGGLMKLVVIGGEPLDVLQQWVVELFSDVRQGSQGKNGYLRWKVLFGELVNFTEGKGSLHYFLKAKGWATSLSAGVSDDGMQ